MKFKQIIADLFYRVRGVLSYIVPKKKGYYIFLPTLDMKTFSGNVKALQLYISRNHKNIETRLIAPSDKVLKAGENLNLQTLKFWSLKALWASLRAEHIIIDASISGGFFYGNFSLVQLWHGSGFKDVGLLYNNLKVDDMVARNNKLKSIYDKYSFVASTSDSEAKKQNLSFGTTNAVVTGYPRNDIFFNEKLDYNKIKMDLEIYGYDKIVLYAPTHRDTMFKSVTPFTPTFWIELQKHLESLNTVFVVKKHPNDREFTVPDSFENIKDLTLKTSDLQELLLITDVLITDYSSIATDFAITRRPIMIYAYDFDSYIENCRSMYYDLENTLPKPFIKDEKDLLEKIIDDSWQQDSEVKESYTKFIDEFHKYLDGNSSERVTKAIQKL